jgi:hypothetical protein
LATLRVKIDAATNLAEAVELVRLLSLSTLSTID